VGIGSKSDCLLGLLNEILKTSDSEVGLKTEKSGGATGVEGECVEVEEALLASERRSLNILSVKKEAKRSAIEVAADEEGKGEANLQLKSLFTVCQRRCGLSDDEETSLEIYCFFGIKDEMMATISKRFKCKPVNSRMSVFKDRFSMTKSSSESTERMRKPGIRLGLTIGDFSDDRSIFIEK